MKSALVVRSVAGIILGLIVAFAYTYFRTAVYQAHAELLIPEKTPTLSLSAIVSSLGTGPGSNIYMIKAILESQNALNRVAKATGIDKKIVVMKTDVKEDAVANGINIDVKDKSKDVALAIDKAYMKALEEISVEIGLPDKTRKIAAMQDLLDKANLKLAFYQRKLKDVYKNTNIIPGIVSASSQQSATVLVNPGNYSGEVSELQKKLDMIQRSIATIQSATATKANQGVNPSDLPPSQKWRDRLTELEYQLKLARISSGEKDPDVVRLKRSIDVTTRTMKNELLTYANSVGKRLIDPTQGSQNKDLADLEVQEVATEADLAATKELADAAPNEAMTLEQVINEEATQTQIVQKYKIEIETSKLDQDSSSSWEVLDPPTLFEDPINKDYKKNMIFGAILGLIGGILLARKKAQPIQQQLV